MIIPAPMELLSFMVLRDNVEKVSGRLLKLGSFHPVDIRQIEDKIRGILPAQVDKENQELESLRIKVRDLIRKLKLLPEVFYGREIQEFFYIETKEFIDNLERILAPLLQQKEEAREEISVNESILAQIKNNFPFALKRGSSYSFLEAATGKVEEKNLIALERGLLGAPHVVFPFGKENSRVLVLLIGLRRDKVLIEKVLKDIDWEEVSSSENPGYLSKEAQKELGRKIEGCRKKIFDIEEKIKQIGGLHREDLVRVNSVINLRKSLLEIQRHSCVTEKTALFSGWVPRAEKNKVISEIKSWGGISYIESRSPGELGIPPEEIPVSFQHSALVKPFEMLIDAYGIPRYGTIDPTIFVAFSFLIMFGAMFGDLGHGMILVCLGLFLAFRKFQRITLNRQAGLLLLYCGVSSAVFGLLYGSAFGFEFASLWLRPMNDIMGIFRAGIILGIILISLGIILNIINSFRQGDYARAVFDKFGLIGGMVYWAAIGLVSKIFFAQGKIPLIYSYLIFGGLLALFIFPIIDNLFIRKHGGFLESLIESAVNILEIFIGYLSNTVSFIRVAAFALAHAGLFLAIFTLARLTDSHTGLGNFLSWIIIIMGNILIVCLEGLIVSIQSLRLNYYEFFSKFFVSGKRMYKPLAA